MIKLEKLICDVEGRNNLNLNGKGDKTMRFFASLIEAQTKKEKSIINCQLQQWITDLPSYIKGTGQNLSCES